MRRVTLTVKTAGFADEVTAAVAAKSAVSRVKEAAAKAGYVPKGVSLLVTPDSLKPSRDLDFGGGHTHLSPADFKETLLEHIYGHLELARASKKARGAAAMLGQTHEHFRRRFHSESQGRPKLDASPRLSRIRYVLDELFSDARTLNSTKNFKDQNTHTDFTEKPWVMSNEPHPLLKTTPTRSWLGTYLQRANFKDPAIMIALRDAVLKLINVQARRGEMPPGDLNRALRRELEPVLRKHLSRSELAIDVVPAHLARD